MNQRIKDELPAALVLHSFICLQVEVLANYFLFASRSTVLEFMVTKAINIKTVITSY